MSLLWRATLERRLPSDNQRNHILAKNGCDEAVDGFRERKGDNFGTPEWNETEIYWFTKYTELVNSYTS